MAAIVKVLLCLLLISNRLSTGEAIQRCLNFPDPRHGRLVCDSLFHLFCAPECDSGFVFEYKPAVVYMCGPLTGDWFTYPEGEKIPWPDCVRKGSSKVADLHPEIMTARRARISQKILETHRGIFPQTYRSAPVDQPDARFNHLFNYIQKAQQMYSGKRTTPSVYESSAQRQQFWVQREKQAMERKLQLQHRQPIQNLQYFQQQSLSPRAYRGQQRLQQTEWYKTQQQLQLQQLQQQQQQQVIQGKLQQNKKLRLAFTDYQPNFVGSSNNIYLQKYQQQKIKTPEHISRTEIFRQTSSPNQAGRLNYQDPAQVSYSPNWTPAVQGTHTGSNIGVSSDVRTSVNQNIIGLYQRPSQQFNQVQRGMFSRPVYASAFRPGLPTNGILNWGTSLTQRDAAKHVTSQPVNYQQKIAVGTTVHNPIKRNATVGRPVNVNQNTGNNFKNVSGGAHTVESSLPRNKQIKNNLFPIAINHTTGQVQNLTLALKKAHTSTPQIERRGGVDEEPVQRKEEKLKTKEKLFYFPIKRDTLINMLPLELKNRYKILKGEALNDKAENANRQENNKQEFLLPGIIQPLSSQNISQATHAQGPSVLTFDDYKAQNSSRQENNKQRFLLPGILQPLTSQNISQVLTHDQGPSVSNFQNPAPAVKMNNTEINDFKFPPLTSATAVPQLAEPAVNNSSYKNIIPEAHTNNDVQLRYAYVDSKSKLLNGTNSDNSLTTDPINIQPFLATNVIEEYSEEPIPSNETQKESHSM